MLYSPERLDFFFTNAQPEGWRHQPGGKEGQKGRGIIGGWKTGKKRRVRKPMRKHKRTGERTGVLAKAATGVMRGRSTGAPAMFHVKPSGDNILYNQTYIRIDVQDKHLHVLEQVQ